MRKAVIIALVLIASSACQPPVRPTSTPSSTSPPPLVSTPPATTETNHRIEIALFAPDARTALTGPVGGEATLIISFRPQKDVTAVTSSGTRTKYSTDWSPNTASEMRYCRGKGRTCVLPDRWVPFATRQQLSIPIDWVGMIEYGVTAQFRDSAGKLVPAGVDSREVASHWVSITGTVDERTPIAAQPLPVQTIIAQSRRAFPVVGSIHVGEGHPIGGKAGSVAMVVVGFQASSPWAEVSEMRIKQDAIGRCLTPDEMSGVDWEPFVEERRFPVPVALNWSTFKLHVQYRDARGNVSMIYCGDVALEGSP
jgi:hypothetical protein